MKSLLKKQLPGIVAVGLVALAVGAASAPASASVASASGLTKNQAKKKKAELKKCGKKPTAKKRTACKKQVNKKYKKLANATPKGKTVEVGVADNYYVPADVQLKVNDSIKWSWSGVKGFEAHNVTLTTGPAGVDRYSYVSQTSAIPSYTFTRQFTTAGDYNFVCTLHTGMEMNVKVSK